MAYLKKAERIYLAAETLAQLHGSTDQVLQMMMELGMDSKAGKHGGRAASWLWEHVGTLVLDDIGKPVCPRLRKQGPMAGYGATIVISRSKPQ